MTETANVYDRITAKIIAALESGTRPWAPSWNGGAVASMPRPRRWNGERYNGINVLMLWDAAGRKGYANPVWMTFKQALELGGNVRKGEKGELVVYANKIVKTETNEATGEESQRAIPFLKGYTVFNAAQCDGLPARFYQVKAPAAPVLHVVGERLPAVDSFVASSGADLRHGGGRAFYNPAGDFVQMPAFESFHDGQGYAATLLHEMIHWTKAPARCDRDMGRKRWGDEGYAREELVAELGAAFLCSDLGVSAEPREDHASYIASWLQVLRGDNRAIFQAASLAQQAADYLHALQVGAAVAEAA